MDRVLQLSQGLLMPLIAAIVAWIAYRQYKTSDNKLRLDLYDRRHQIFNKLVSALQEILTENKVKDEHILNLHTIKIQGYFLFEEDVSNYLDEVFKKVDNLHMLIRTFIDQQSSNANQVEETKRDLEEKSQLMKWIEEQFEISKTKFAKYLDFRSLGKI